MESGYHGNDLVVRDSSFPHLNVRSYIDLETSLPTGRLDKVLLYVRSPQDILAPYFEYVRLQVWRPVPGEEYVLKLVWENVARVERRKNAGALHQVGFHDRHFGYLDISVDCLVQVQRISKDL